MGAMYELIDTQVGLERACRALGNGERLFLDTEFESSRSGAELSLLQVSNGSEIFLIDALRLRALESLSALLARAREWVLHAGLQDVSLLKSRLGLADPPPIFDTQIGWALIGPEHSVSLAYLVYRVLGIRTSKPHQADDWKRRPLPSSQLEYAAGDVEYLPALRTALGEQSSALGREALVAEASRELLFPRPEARTPLSLDAFRNAWQLDRHSQAALRFLIEWYERLSDAEPEWAPEAKTLFAIASRLPESADELGRIKGVPRRFSAEQGNRLTGGLMRATAEADAADFREIEPPPYATFEEIRLDAWLGRMRAELSTTLSVAPELAFPARLVRRLRPPLADGDIERAAAELHGFRAPLLREAFLAFCRAEPPPVGGA